MSYAREVEQRSEAKKVFTQFLVRCLKMDEPQAFESDIASFTNSLRTRNGCDDDDIRLCWRAAYKEIGVDVP